MSIGASFDRALRDARGLSPYSDDFDAVVVAVSGGSDSMALLHLATDWARREGVTLCAVTVDHGLRPEAAAEARMVEGVCRGLGVDHVTLRWPGWSGQGNLQAAAREARYGLIAGVAARFGRPVVLIGHTKNDLAETFLMRLARGSGVDGLAAMRGTWVEGGTLWLRPLIEVERAALRDWLARRGVAWAEDPTNEDAQYTRVKARRALGSDTVAELGLGIDRLAGTAQAMGRVRAALEQYTQETARRVARTEAGDVIFAARDLAQAPDEVRLRLMAHAIRWVGSATYRPRFEALLEVDATLSERGRMPLGGALFLRSGDHIRVTREAKAVATTRAAPGDIWDNRWRLDGPADPSHVVAVLGAEGLKDCPGWRETGLPRESLIASPAIWTEASGGAELVAAPLAGAAKGWQAVLCPPMGDFFSSLLSH